MKLQGVRGGYKGIQGKLQGVTGGYKGLQGGYRGFTRGLQWVTGVTGGYKGLRGVTTKISGVHFFDKNFSF